MAPFVIRPATLEDAANLADLGIHTFRETFEPLYDPADFAAFLAEAYGPEIQRAELRDPSRPALLLEVEGVPVGFAQLWLDHHEPCVAGLRPAELQRIYLLRSAQGGGRGAALLAACEARVRTRGADILWLGVWECNARALAFYARSGFHEVGEHAFRIGTRLDRDLILAKGVAMNLILLLPEDLTAPDRARLTGRRLAHVREVHRAVVGDDLVVGLLGGGMGRGRVLRLDDEVLEVALTLDQDPPPKLPLTLVVALPRPKVLNRVVAASASLGVARLVLVNAWKVEKAYWSSPRMTPESLRQQLILGLEQAKDTVLPELRLARLFRPFVEDDLPALVGGGTGLVAHPGSGQPFPKTLAAPVTLAIGPEGGWVDAEVASLLRAGLRPLDLGPRILRTETALAALVGRLF